MHGAAEPMTIPINASQDLVLLFVGIQVSNRSRRGGSVHELEGQCLHIHCSPAPQSQLYRLDCPPNVLWQPGCLKQGAELLRYLELPREVSKWGAVGILLAFGIFYRLSFYFMLRFFVTQKRK